ncbi:MAG: hypothetical protein IMZ50_06050 [Candidatus Atribacteria bacterium]|nr:hypothetical protein [Candidatus Atribacteria bacterium]
MSGTDQGRLILVTGPSGSGKTRWCLALADYASILGIHVGGLVSPAVFEGDLKIGIDLLDLRSGAQRRLAVRRGESTSGQITTDWHFDDEALNWGNTVLEQLGACQLLILDELGPLELQRGVGLTNGLGLVAARRYRLACVVVRPSLLEIAQPLWPWGEVFYLPTRQPLEAPA